MYQSRLKWSELPKRIAVLGDSIALGRTAEPGTAWSDRLHNRHVSADPASHMVFNLGIGGNTSSDINRRAVSELTERNVEGTVLLVGVNDLRMKLSNGEQEIPYNEFVENYRSIVTNCLEFGPVEVLSLFPLSASNGGVLGGYTYAHSQWKKYNSGVLEVAGLCNVHATQVSALVSDHVGESLHHDLVHPNSIGHGLIYDALDKSFSA